MTRHETVTDEIRDAASLYSLGLLDPDEAERFESHLNACPVCSPSCEPAAKFWRMWRCRGRKCVPTRG
jgi:hypothetical protein